MLEAVKISKRIQGRDILSSCSLRLKPGTFTAVVGPNGAGKTSLLKVISGEDRKFNGDVMLNGRCIRKYKIRELSKVRAILPQQTVINFPFTIEQVVEIGRYTHRASPEANRQIVDESINVTGMDRFRGRMYHTLSGGEKQRVQMARVISQISSDSNESKYMLLDEPTSSLDLAQQHMLLALARKMCDQKIGVMAVLHDLNLAMQYADEILLLKEGNVVAYGALNDVISAEVIENTFGHPVRLIHDQGQPLIVPETNRYRTANGEHQQSFSSIRRSLEHTESEHSLLSYSYNGK